MDNRYTWENNVGTIFSDLGNFQNGMKPVFSFDFDTIYYRPEHELQYRIFNNERFDLTETEIEEILKFCDDFINDGKFLVHAYEPDGGLYIGAMTKADAEQANYKFVMEEPPFPTCKRVNDAWERIVAVIWDTGQLIMNPIQICQKCVIQLTQEEFDNFPKQPEPYYLWDFKTERWEDKRNVEDTKKRTYLAIRNAFESVRWRMNAKYIPQFEQATWEEQYREATGFLKDESFETPYIDTFLEYRTDNKIPTKRELCEDIIKNYKFFITEMAKANAKEWSYLKQVDMAMESNEVENILTDANTYVQAFLWG